jgi:KTSC domain
VLREVVDSSSLRSIGYDRKTQTLEVEFKNGGVYRYSEVPLELWTRLQKAASKGKFLQDNVRDHFSTTRL